MALKDWKEQTSKGQKEYGGKQFINKKNKTQIYISRWDYKEKPNNWAFYVSSVEEARKGYPSQKLGITKSKAIALLKSYMRKH